MILLKKIVLSLITLLASLVLKKYRPSIVGVTGSVGKTGTKNAIAAVLAAKYRVRASPKSYNSEFGVPLTILGSESARRNSTRWLGIMLEGLSLTLFRQFYPDWLVLEVGVDRPGDISRITAYVPFDVAVLTRLPLVPVHIEFFPTLAHLMAEKGILPKAVPTKKLVVLNADDANVMSLRPELKARVITCGFIAGDLRGSNDHLLYENNRPVGFAFKVDYQGNSFPIRARHILSREQAFGLMVALVVGLEHGINPLLAIPVLENLVPTPGRLCLLTGIKDSLIIDDSYNSSPAALETALAVLKSIETAGRRIAVLGDMLELGEHTIPAHQAAGVEAARVADLIVTVGLRAKFIYAEAEKKRFSRDCLRHFDNAGEAGRYLQNEIKANDLILVKGSQSMRLERAVEEIMAHPEDKEKLLVRQEKEWADRT